MELSMRVYIGIVFLYCTLCYGQSTSSTSIRVSQKDLTNAGNLLPEDVSEYTQKFYGEDGELCADLVAKVLIQNGSSSRSQEAVKKAVAQAVVQNLDQENEFQAAQESAVAILEVIAQASGSVIAEVVSPHPGCWGIAYGRAYAAAAAEGTATAIAEAFTSAKGKTAEIELEAITQEAATNVSKAVDSVAALVALGDGQSQSITKQVQVEAKVQVMACALARAFAIAKDEEASGAAVVTTGCEQVPPPTAKDAGDALNCQCRTFGDQPQGCGTHGINGANDYICYVKNPNMCSCSQRSNQYPGQAWRYCGQSLTQMQIFLNSYDASNAIDRSRHGYGYCGGLDS